MELSSGSPQTYPYDVLVGTVFALKSDCHNNAVWVMNSGTAAWVRKFRDAHGRMLWAGSLAQGQSARLMGYPVVVHGQMPATASNSHLILFGDFRRAYGIFDTGGLRVTLDNNITTPVRLK